MSAFEHTINILHHILSFKTFNKKQHTTIHMIHSDI